MTRDTWYGDDEEEAGRFVPLYVLVNGRTSPRNASLDLATQVIALPVDTRALEPEYEAIVSRCWTWMSIAEIAAYLNYPLALTKLLVDVLLEWRLPHVSAPRPRSQSWIAEYWKQFSPVWRVCRQQEGLIAVGRKSVKVVVAGGFGTGKTTLVGSVSEIPPLTTEEVLTQASVGVDDLAGVEDKTTTTVALDFGRITINADIVLYIFGTPGQDRFWFMWDELAQGAIGAIVLVDTRRLDTSFSSDRLLRTATASPSSRPSTCSSANACTAKRRSGPR